MAWSKGGCGALPPVAPGSCLRRRDPAASGDTSGWESTKGKRSCGLLRSGLGRSVPDAEGGSASPTSLVRDTKVQRGDHPGSAWSPWNRQGRCGNRGASLLIYAGDRDPSVRSYQTWSASAPLRWAGPPAHPVCERPSCSCVRKHWVFLDTRSGDLGPPAHLCGLAKTLATHPCRRTDCRAVSE